MGITVRGPYSGNPVKVRDQDVGRAVRDEEGRVFYVLPKSDGSGYYGAMTRAGGSKDEARALEFEDKAAVSRGNVHEQVEAVHDATGKGRGLSGTILVIVFLVLLAIAVIVVKFGPWGDLTKTWQQNPAPPAQIPMGPSSPTPPPASP